MFAPQIAVKTLLPTHLSSSTILNDFKQEVQLLSKLNHTCLVSFVGAGAQLDHVVWVSRPTLSQPPAPAAPRSPLAASAARPTAEPAGGAVCGDGGGDGGRLAEAGL